jgi:hypothetical protein
MLAALIILAVCFAAGMAARTRLGAGISAALERAIARKIPGFGLIKSATGQVANIQSQSDIALALKMLGAFFMSRSSTMVSVVFV